jgi:hypothetical protein
MLVAGTVFSPAREAHAQDADTIVAKVSRPLRLDGTMSDPLWREKRPVTSFTNFVTGASAGLERTEAFLYYDAQNLYVAFDCGASANRPVDSQNVDDLRARSVDFVGFQIDTSGNGTRIYEFDATPTGLRYQMSSESTRYQPAWNVAGGRSGSGYVVTMSIPLSALRADASKGNRWRINFIRHLAGSNDDYTWAYATGLSDLHGDPRYWRPIGAVNISRRATRPGPSAEVYALGSVGEDRAFSSFSANRSMGVDLKVPVTNTSAIVATLHPDFSNVDSDQTTIAPQEFRLRLDETRPFFAQGKNYVAPLAYPGIAATPVLLFYTPSIGVFDRGVKFEGTEGRIQYGALEAASDRFHDRAYGLQYSNAQHSIAVALQGVDAVHGTATDSSLGYSVYAQNPNSGVFAGVSQIRERGAFVDQPGAAVASVTSFGLHDRRWNVGIGAESIGPEFAPFDAFVSNSDIQGHFATVAYTDTPSSPVSALKSYSFSYVGGVYRNWGGSRAETDSLFSASATTKSLYTLGAFADVSILGLYDEGFPVYRGQTYQRFNTAGFSLGYRDGTATPVDASYSVGPFGVFCGGTQESAVCAAPRKGGAVDTFVRQVDFRAERPLGKLYSVAFEYGGTEETAIAAPLADSQWLRRVSVSRALGKRGSFNVLLRQISGTGGFATPGTNLSAGLNAEFKNLDRLYLEFGAPSSIRTRNRAVIKYVFHVGSGQGT